MSNVDDLCVKYVFDELDPSEIMLVEQAMIEDQNLLIEVESLKSTWRKLRKIPEIKPPKQLSEAIINHAHEHSNQMQLFGGHWKNPGLMATAAVVIFSLLITTAYLLPYDDSSSKEKSGKSQVAGVSGSPVAGIESEKSENDASREKLTPWIDRSNMIYIEHRNKDGNLTQSPDSLFRMHGEKIPDPPTDQMIIPPSLHDFHLTGTRF